ncbi:hypothetical protein [Mesorhizobium sp. B2-1-2]|uniref:hypothetical protein n=1 Tax=Mesorhizobium sp. B2-1-2 TaxID=2589973 RepID=UPI00112E367E|nr:hypothetical protein [Mesorhizobium sp. B2-1-2]TPN04511.1 hypothetical protein FJ971_29640 [Mesorhizobium sp. B2-1-2]
MTILLKLLLIVGVLGTSAFGFAYFFLFAVSGRRQFLRWAIVLIVSAFVLSHLAKPVQAKPIAYLIDGDMGGAMLRYEQKAKIIGGAKVVIDGVCLSACTMYLRRDWNLDVCYTPSATFGFHKPFAWLRNSVVTGTMAIANADASWRSNFFEQMPARIRVMLSGKSIPSPAAGDPMDRFVFVKARDVGDAVKPCPKDWAARYKLVDVQSITTGIGAQ